MDILDILRIPSRCIEILIIEILTDVELVYIQLSNSSQTLSMNYVIYIGAYSP